MGSSDFSSMPSEPQDIGKWFSSYVYQSPELSGIDSFQDSDVSRVPETQESEDRTAEFSDKNDLLEKWDLLHHKCKVIAEDNCPKELPLCNVQIPESKEGERRRAYNLHEDNVNSYQDSDVSRVPETEESEDRGTEDEVNMLEKRDLLLHKCKSIACGKISREALEYANSTSVVSEPPDLKNWFASYVYESPALDIGYESGLRSKEDHREEEENNAPTCCEGRELFLIESKATVNISELTNSGATSGGLANCVNFVENKEPQHEYFLKDSQNTNGIQHVDKLNDRTSQQENNHGSTRKRTEGLFSNSPGHLWSIEDASGLSGIKSSSKSKGTEPKNSPEKKHLCEESLNSKDGGNRLNIVASPDKFDKRMIAGGKLLNMVHSTSGHEEKGTSEITDGGFISTRKSRSKQTNKENSFKSQDSVKPEIQILDDEMPLNINKAASRREVLQDRTNFQPPYTYEKTGKWRCPQKNKPYIGPPMKQLRLEQWVRRVQKL